MNADARLVSNIPRERGALEADEIDVDPIGRQRVRVVPHAGAASQVSECDDDGSHVGKSGGGFRLF